MLTTDSIRLPNTNLVWSVPASAPVVTNVRVNAPGIYPIFCWWFCRYAQRWKWCATSFGLPAPMTSTQVGFVHKSGALATTFSQDKWNLPMTVHYYSIITRHRPQQGRKLDLHRNKDALEYEPFWDWDLRLPSSCRHAKMWENNATKRWLSSKFKCESNLDGFACFWEFCMRNVKMTAWSPGRRLLTVVVRPGCTKLRLMMMTMKTSIIYTLNRGDKVIKRVRSMVW